MRWIDIYKEILWVRLGPYAAKMPPVHPLRSLGEAFKQVG
jgi:hypothetical protein